MFSFIYFTILSIIFALVNSKLGKNVENSGTVSIQTPGGSISGTIQKGRSRSRGRSTSRTKCSSSRSRSKGGKNKKKHKSGKKESVLRSSPNYSKSGSSAVLKSVLKSDSQGEIIFNISFMR
jgi:hypothetical protein